MTRLVSKSFFDPGLGKAFGSPDLFAIAEGACSFNSITIVRSGLDAARDLGVLPFLPNSAAPFVRSIATYSFEKERGVEVSQTVACSLSIIGLAASGAAARRMPACNKSAVSNTAWVFI